MHVFRSLPPDVLSNIRAQIEAAERPHAAALEASAIAIQSTEAFKGAVKNGLIPQMTASELVEQIERMRRDRFSTDATRKSADRRDTKRSSGLKTDEAEGVITDEWVLEQFNEFFHGRREAMFNNGASLIALDQIVAELTPDRVMAERLMHEPRIGALLINRIAANYDRFEAEAKAA